MSNALPSRSPDDRIEIERGAFNAAFHELGLPWHWDVPTFSSLAGDACDRARVRRYLEREQAHLLRVYDADFLADAILVAKERLRLAFAGSAPSGIPSFAWADPRWGQVGI